MMRLDTFRNLVLLGFSLISMSVAATAMASDVYVIAHPSVELTQAELKDVYLGDKQFVGRMQLMPVDNAAIQGDFLAKALKMKASQYTALWIKKGFRNSQVAPETKSGDAEVIKFVQKTPGALGYVGAPAAGVKVLHTY